MRLRLLRGGGAGISGCRYRGGSLFGCDLGEPGKDPQDYAGRKKPVGGRRTTRDARDTKYIQMPTYAAMAHMKNLSIDGLRVNIAAADFQRLPRSALALFGVEGAEIRGVTRSPAGNEPPIIQQQDSRNIRLMPEK